MLMFYTGSSLYNLDNKSDKMDFLPLSCSREVTAPRRIILSVTYGANYVTVIFTAWSKRL